MNDERDARLAMKASTCWSRDASPPICSADLPAGTAAA
jgi:hypothetical protein